MLENREWTDRLAPRSDEPLPKVRQLYMNLFNAITSGDLPYNTILPSSRELAVQLGVGRNTVVAAYEQLANESLIIGEGRRGSRVCFRHTGSPDSATRSSGSASVLAAADCADWSSEGQSSEQQVAPLRSGDTGKLALRSVAVFKDLAPGMPDASIFPQEQWRRAMVKASRVDVVMRGYQLGSLPELQAAIVRFLAVYRSLNVTEDQVIVTSGTRQSLVLAAALYARTGDTAWVESPGYAGAWEAFEVAGLKIAALQVDDKGLCLPAGSRLPSPAIIYTTPCFQYPSGVVLDAHRRNLLLQIASERRCVVFEDDYDSEFRDTTQARPALAASAAGEGATILHAGTFSKIIFPAARVAWLIVPESDVQRANETLRAIGGGHTSFSQATVAELLDNGAVASHLQRARRVYAGRREKLIQLLSNTGLFKSPGDTGGCLSMVAYLQQPLPRRQLNDNLQAAQLGARCLEEFTYANRSRKARALVLGLGNVTVMQLPDVVARLQRALRDSRVVR